MVPRSNLRERLVRLCHSLALLLQVLAAPAQDPPYRAFTDADGLPSNTVYSAIQDRDGYLWFGTDAGACRFDGRHFEVFTTSNGLVDNEVLSIFEDSRGRIWFLSLNGHLCYWLNGRFFTSAEHPEFATIRPVSGFMSIAEGTDGRLWFSGQAGDIFSWHGGRVSRASITDPCDPAGQSGGLPRFVHIPGEEPWVALVGSLHRAEQGRLQFVRCWGRTPDGFAMATRWGNDVAAFGEQGLMKLNAEKEVVLIPEARLPAGTSYRSPCAGRQGEIWLPASAGGVVVISPGGVPRVTPRVLQRMNVNSSMEDMDGNRWLCTDGHGAVLIAAAQQQMLVSRPHDDLLSGSVTSVLVLRDGTVVFGTATGTVHALTKLGMVRWMDKPNGAALRDRVRDLQEAPDGRIWVAMDSWCGFIHPGPLGTRAVQAQLLDPRMESLIQPLKTGLKSLAIGPDGAVIGSMFGVGDMVEGPGGPCFKMSAGYWPEQQRIYAPFIDQEGAVWFETNEMLHRWKDGTRTDHPQISLQFGSRITDIDQLSDGTLVIATAGKGLQLVRDGGIVRAMTRADGLPSDQCRAAIVRHDTILVATDAGAALIAFAANGPAVRSWGLSSGLPSSDVQDIDSHGTSLYLATPAGLCVVPMVAPEVELGAPPFHLTGLTTGGSVLDLNDTVRIPLGGFVEATFLAIDFVQPGAVRYSFRNNSDTTWQHQTSAVVTLNGSAPGTHRYSFRASRPGSGQSRILGLVVHVVPPWYSTIWMRSLALVLLVLAGVLLARFLMRHQLRQRLLELERGQAQQQERQRIAADMHDDLGADLSHLLLLARETKSSGTLGKNDGANVAAIEQHAERMTHKIDEIIWSLEPSDDRLLATLSFLQRHCEEFAASRRMNFRTKPVEGQDRPYPSILRRELHLLMKEILINIAKHTNATMIRFEARIGDDHFILVIEDDGTPIPSLGNGRGGHGQANVRQRLVLLHAEMESSSLAPMGTRLSIRARTNEVHPL